MFGKGGSAGLTLHASDKWQQEMMEMRLYTLANPLVLNDKSIKIPCHIVKSTDESAQDHDLKDEFGDDKDVAMRKLNPDDQEDSDENGDDEEEEK